MPLERWIFSAAGRAEMSHSRYSGILCKSKMGDDGARLINGREDPDDQDWEIEILAAGSGTHFKEKK